MFMLNSFFFAASGGEGNGPTPEHFATSTFVSGSTNLNVTYPPSLQANDIAIIHAIIVDSTDANGISAPSGFTQIDQRPIFSPASTSSKAGIFWKRLTGSESGTVTVAYTGPMAGTDTAAAIMTIWRGCKTSGDPYEDPDYSISNAYNTSLTGPAVTTTGPNRRIVHFGCTYTQGSCTAASGYSEVYDNSTNAGTGEGSINCYQKERTAAGTESSAVHTLSGNLHSQTFALALIPA